MTLQVPKVQSAKPAFGEQLRVRAHVRDLSVVYGIYKRHAVAVTLYGRIPFNPVAVPRIVVIVEVEVMNTNLARNPLFR